MKILGDILLDVKAKYPTIFTTPTMQRYIRFVTIEGAMGGMFVYRTPKEFIEGYTDPIVEILSK